MGGVRAWAPPRCSPPPPSVPTTCSSPSDERPSSKKSTSTRWRSVTTRRCTTSTYLARRVPAAPSCAHGSRSVTSVEQPPDAPDAWSDEQWMEWLNATHDGESEPDHRVYAPRLSSRGGVVLGAAMMGLERGIYG